jgi:hypothetical protein
LSSPKSRRFLPAAEEPSDLRHHQRDVLILSAREPAPANGESEVHAHPRQRLVGDREPLETRRPLAEVRLLEPLAEIERGLALSQ